MNIYKRILLLVLATWLIPATHHMHALELKLMQSNNTIGINLHGTKGIHYRLQSTTDLSSNLYWKTVTNILGNDEEITMSFLPSGSARFFRILPVTNPVYSLPLYLRPDSVAAQQALIWNSDRPEDSLRMKKIADVPTAEWFHSGINDTAKAVSNIIDRANTQGTVAVLVAYNIPLRDCGSYSSGGAESSQEYLNWITSFAQGINTNKAIVILEPDALAAMDCLSPSNQLARIDLLKQSVEILKSTTRAIVYLDAGHSRWYSSSIMVDRLKKAGIEKADGFSLNVSNFVSDEESKMYGSAISHRVGDKHFIIDTSRNGLGPAPNNEWCNPPGRALGRASTTVSDHPLVDAYIWIKSPGFSDGTCNGGPSAGVWWPDYALMLAELAGY